MEMEQVRINETMYHHQRNEIKDDGTNGTCSAFGDTRNACKI
jgi:hypothetical protein